MMNSQRLRARQEKMFARHHSKPRPYDHARKKERRRRLNRVMLMFERNFTITQIADATGLSKVGVALYRDVFYLPWKQKITKH